MSTSDNPALFGADAQPRLVAVELHERSRNGDRMILFTRDGDKVTQAEEPFQPFIVAEAGTARDCPDVSAETELKGRGPLNRLLRFETWKACRKAVSWFSRAHGPQGRPGAPYLCFNDPVHQYLLLSGKTLFGDMAFEEVRRMQVDIECFTTAGYEFCNAEREGDRVIAIAMADQSGWTEVLSGADMDETDLLARFVAVVNERDPDVLEGHNIFNFDLSYLAARCKRHRVPFTLGRDGRAPKARPSRLSIAERTLAYQRFDVFGRHVVDTLFLVHAYDVSHRSLTGFGLKEVAVHFGFAAKDRTYLEPDAISGTFTKDPETVMRYALDDVRETRDVGTLLSRSHFVQAQLLPYAYQNVCVRGTATKVDALMIREYLRRGQALPKPDTARSFAGGYTDVFVTGVVNDVHHCDVRSLYPSLMLTRNLGPRKDTSGVFLDLLGHLRNYRLEAKAAMAKAGDDRERDRHDAVQTTFKILINSFYGYLGFGQARFSDFDRAEKVTADGRELLRAMIDWLRKHKARPVEIDTDGIYFVPPAACLAGGRKGAAALAKFQEAFTASLPEGIDVEFDGDYRSMYSYKMKNYALLSRDGEVVIKGGALKSRGLEPFQREFVEGWLRLKLEARDDEVPALYRSFREAITERAWPVTKFAKREMLQESPARYAEKTERGDRSRAAAYELALKSEREYRAGDHIAYYVTGEKKSVAVHEVARLTTEWDPGNRDENVAYYLAKLDALCKKLEIDTSGEKQGELGL